ncbi:type III pantothenate kinase [uncultured Marinobacter sp.]|uniref:type III pantothenate kinase n=1 Tax=uncultured Marinobacter sp. TaxID=187379 RepID=UPI0030DBC9F9
MRLYLDGGNTRIKWQLRDGGQVTVEGGGNLAGTDLFADAADYSGQIESVAVSTVRSETDQRYIEQALQRLTDAPVTFYWTRAQYRDLVCGYQDFDRMGADRWHAMVAVRGLTREPVVVIDAGSAITVDWIAASGQHEGGYIVPGRRLMLESLRQNTARVLFEPDFTVDGLRPGQSTQECVSHGVNWALQALARQLALDPSIHGRRVYLTGGDGLSLTPAFCGRGIFIPDLVFDGLERVACGL